MNITKTGVLLECVLLLTVDNDFAFVVRFLKSFGWRFSQFAHETSLEHFSSCCVNS